MRPPDPRPVAALPDPDCPLGPHEARALLRPLARARSVLLAVSGGPDSTALMHLAAAAAAADPAFPALAVATVDHGLRDASRAEADGVARAAERLGLPCHRLAWDGPKPATRLQERARHHRYALLTGCARRTGAGHLVTAHTLDDQAETVLFRLMRGSGVAGLAGMAADVERDGLRHLRPLLGVAKARLVATCRAAGWGFTEDPGNADPRFARARLRALMPALAAEGLDAPRFATLARRMGEADAALSDAARRAVDEAREGPGVYAARRLLAEPAAVRQRALAILIPASGGTAGAPRLDGLERLADALGAASIDGRPLRRTLHGASLAFDGRDRLEVGAMPARRPSRPTPPKPDDGTGGAAQ